MTIKWRQQWDDKADAAAREATNISFEGTTTIVDQEAAADTDINVIMKRMGVKDGSTLPYWSTPEGIYGDISFLPTDPTELVNIIHEGQLRFAALPADVRQRFTTPEELFHFLSDDKNVDEARKLGLLKTPEVKGAEPPIEPPAVN